MSMNVDNKRLEYYTSKWQFIWLCGLILSFAYERPLGYLTPYDRTNPRLFDVFVIVGVLLVLPKIRHISHIPQSFKIWRLLVIWFCFCAITWAALMDWRYGKFSLFVAAKYLEGLIAIYIALRIRLDSSSKRILHGMLVLCGVFVAVYCIPEYFRGGSSVMVRPDLEVNIGTRVLVGPYGASYFQLSQSSSLFFAFSLSYFLSSHRKIIRYLGLLISALIAWPMFFCGARTGLALVIISAGVLIILEKRLRRSILVLAMIMFVVFFSLGYSKIFQGIKSGTTIERMQSIEGGDDSIKSRMSQILNFNLSDYKEGNLLALIGGGFYVVPTFNGGTSFHYRIDYGIHSMYLFPFEQAGLLGISLFVWFLFVTVKRLFVCRKYVNMTDLNFINSFLAYFIASLVVGIGGHNFWQGFGSGNFNTLFIMCLVIALIPSANYNLVSNNGKTSLQSDKKNQVLCKAIYHE